jgi:hypothetical protein
MSAKPQLANTFSASRAHRFAGARWLEFARKLAKRYRARLRRLGLAMLWPRRARVRWLRERWLLSQGNLSWELNLGLSMGSKSARSVLNLPSSAQSLMRTLFLNPVQKGREPHAHPRIAHHFIMQRFVAPQVPVALQPLRILAEPVVHTSVRPIVRESVRVEHRLVSRPAVDRAHRSEPGTPESRFVTAREVSAPAAAPLRAPEINVAQIADQVMRQLDHRISSWRERRGRS